MQTGSAQPGVVLVLVEEFERLADSRDHSFPAELIEDGRIGGKAARRPRIENV